MNSTEDYNNVEKGLISRGFVNIEGMDNLGDCNKNDKHFILRTDGLIKYSTFWDAHANAEDLDRHDKYCKSKGMLNKNYRHIWGIKEFSFKELDEIMEIVDI